MVAELTADQIFQEFMENDSVAASKYAEKVVQVSGEIYGVELNENEPQIVLSTNDPSGFVRCGFEKDSTKSYDGFSVGDQIKLKGFCTGINKAEGLGLLDDVDVNLKKCIIIE